MYSRLFGLSKSGNCGIKYPSGSCSSFGDDSTEVAVSNFVGTLKGRTAIRVFNRFRELKRRPYWGNRFWARGYCADTVGLDAEKIRKYVRYQERKEREAEQRGFDF